jgi:hypothetical protein
MKKKLKIIFIAGPYTGDGSYESIEKNIREAEKYQLALADKQIGFFCAHNHTEHFSSKKGAKAPEQFYYDLDFHFLTHIADAVLAMPSWEKSSGAKREIEWAKKKGMKIFYPKNPKDMNDIIKWVNKK